MRSILRSAIPASARRLTAASFPCGPPSRTAIKSTSSRPKRRRRLRLGSVLWLPERPALGSGGSFGRSSANSISISARPSYKRRSGKRAMTSPRKRLMKCCIALRVRRETTSMSRSAKVVTLTPRGKTKKASENAVPIRGMIPGMAVHFAGCCHPLPGDRIVGIVTTGKGVTNHPIDCETLDSFAETPERWLDVAWSDDGDAGRVHVGRVSVTIGNEPGSLGSLTTVIGKGGGNITNLKITNRSQDFFEILVDIEVQNVRHLTNIIAALRATPVINSVERARG